MNTLSSDECCVCGSNQLVTIPDSGEIVCEHCGIVISDKTEEKGPEWRVVTSTRGREGDYGNRTGMPFSLARSDMGLSTIMGRINKDARGNKINSSMLSRLRRWDSRTQLYASTDKNLTQAFVQLNTLKDKLGLPSAVIEKTAYIYRKAQQRGLTRGRSISALLAAAIYIVCRQMGIPRTLDDIAIISNTKRKPIAKCYRLIIFELDLKLPIIDTTKCIARVANKVNLSERTKHRAIDLMNDVVKSGLSAGKDPMGLAATVVYASCVRTGERKTQIDIANAADTTEVTIRNRFKEIKNRLELDR